MSGKLSEVEGRIGTVHQLEAVITAMRGSAAARSLEARGKLPAIEAYASVIGRRNRPGARHRSGQRARVAKG